MHMKDTKMPQWVLHNTEQVALKHPLLKSPMEKMVVPMKLVLKTSRRRMRRMAKI
jgi:hypothetical protein